MTKPSLIFPTVTSDTYYTFDPESEAVWPALVQYLKDTKTTTPIYLAEPNLALEPLFYSAARVCQLPAIVAPASHLPLIIHIIEQTNPDTFVGQAHLIRIVLDAYHSHNGTDSSSPIKQCFTFKNAFAADVTYITQEYSIAVHTDEGPSLQRHTV